MLDYGKSQRPRDADRFPAMTGKSSPWKKRTPRTKRAHLTAAQKQQARTRAAKAGRRYPNLIDNMYVARKARATS